MELLKRALEAPPAWLSQLAEDCAFYIQTKRYLEMQDRVRREAEKHRLQPMKVARMVAEEWDRLGIVRVGVHFPGMN